MKGKDKVLYLALNSKLCKLHEEMKACDDEQIIRKKELLYQHTLKKMIQIWEAVDAKEIFEQQSLT